MDDRAQRNPTPRPLDADVAEPTRPPSPPPQFWAGTRPPGGAAAGQTPGPLPDAASDVLLSEPGLELAPENASQAWQVVSEQVEALVEAWESGRGPVDLGEFLPAGKPALRRLVLIELVKVDLMYRWRHPQLERMLEQYLAEFPELSDGPVPYDLVYEEYHVRKQAGRQAEPEEYFKRFPEQASQLRRLLEIERDQHLSTSLARGQRLKELNVGEQLDDFDLLTRVGKGAFATVFLARQRSMQRLVALKVSADRGNEPQTMAQLDHPHIVRVYDQRLLAERQLRLLYMQYVPGGTLQGVVERVRGMPAAARSGNILLEAVDEILVDHGESPPAASAVRRRLAEANWPRTVCWLGSRLAAALDYAHSRGVMHRDLKPANVLLAADGSPKLADFNISFCSKLEGSTPAAYFGGSLAYMSPEQLEAFNPAHERGADELDSRSDIYSLGVLLWELLTGSRPFKDAAADGAWEQTLERMAARRRAGPDPAVLAQWPRDCPPGLEQALLKCLAPEPGDRFATAGQLARQLELCQQPQVQRLFERHPGGWRRMALGMSLPALVLVGLAPNAVASGLNIAYNYFEIVRDLGPAAREVFYGQLLVVNPVAYMLAIGVLVPLAWPVLRRVRRIRRGPGAEPSSPLARARCLALGDYVAGVSAAEWAFSGIVFPVWLHLEAADLNPLQYIHFLTSQALCGLIAATLSFFFVTFLAVRSFYPMLLEPDAGDAGGLEHLQRLARRTNRYFLLAVSAPLVAIFAVALLTAAPDPVEAGRGQDQLAIVVLVVVGFAALALAYRLSQQIHQDINALSLAMTPLGDLLAPTSDTYESFWSASR